MMGKVRVASRAREPAADFEPRYAGQHPVEDDEVGRIFGEAQRGFVAARHALDHIAFRLQVVAEQQSEIRLVLDDENARRGGGAGTGDVLARLVHHHLLSGVGFDVRLLAPARPLVRQVRTGHQVEHGLGNVRGVVADPLDILGAEQKMGAERDVARILHHVRQEIAEDRVFEGVELGVPLPDVARPLDVALGVGVEHVLQ